MRLLAGGCPMIFPSFFRQRPAASDRQRASRPHLECLEDRCLLAGSFGQVNLASDVPGLARVMDPNLVNPWGIASSPTGPFWFADNGSGVSDIVDGGPGFTVSENGLSAPSRFLFATEDGTISGWAGVVDPTRAFLAVDNSS